MQEETLTLKNGKVIEYSWELANERGIFVVVYSKITEEEKRQFKNKICSERDVVAIHYTIKIAPPQQVGKCPKCGGEEIEYGASEIQDNQLYYSAVCASCSCSFREWYNLVFSENVIYS